jgi:hypothetical protein
VNYGAPLQVSTLNAAAIRKVGLVRLGSVTHSVDMEQRYVPLSFTAGTGTLTATGPANANVASPGPYMLFIVDANGVPSVAPMVTVAPASANVPPTTSITSPANGASFARRTAITITAAASDSDGTIQEVEFFRGDGATKLAQDTTAPYSHRWTPTSPGTKQSGSRPPTPSEQQPRVRA